MSLLLLAGVSVAVVAASSFTMLFAKTHFDPRGKHCYVAGASQGLGLAVARQLVKRGAHVTIVARTPSKLDAAIVQLEGERLVEGQKIKAVAADLTTAEGASRALTTACEPFEGRCAEVVISCVGGAAGILGFWVELTPDQLRQAVDQNYWTVAWTAHAAARLMAKQRVQGTIVFTSSILGLMAIPGYSAYTPVKYAIRGLAESLRCELLLYKIKVHCYFPATILSPGFDEEQKTKPTLTKIIEGPDDGLVPDEAAKRLLKGLDRNEFLITTDVISNLFRCSMRGLAPHSHYILDPVYALLGAIGIPIWRRVMESQVRSHIVEHERDVISKLP